MSILNFIILLIVAAICGSVGMAIAGFSRGGLILAIIVGFIGAWLGTWLAAQLGLPPIFVLNINGQSFPVVWAIIGSALFAAILGLLFRGRRRRVYY